MPPVRRAIVQPGGGGRQPDEADVHCHEAGGAASVSSGEDRGDDEAHGGGWKVDVKGIPAAAQGYLF